jgi:hypothetical protein
MIIYRGYGLAIFGVIFGSALVADLLASTLGGPNYWDTHGWPMAASLAVDSLVLLSIDRIMSDKQARIPITELPAKSPGPPRRHDLFFLSFRWWALILAGLAILILLFHWSRGPG